MPRVKVMDRPSLLNTELRQTTAEVAHPPVHTAHCAFSRDDGVDRLQALAQRSVWVLDGQWRFEPARDRLDIGSSGIAQLFRNVPTVGIARRRPPHRACARVAETLPQLLFDDARLARINEAQRNDDPGQSSAARMAEDALRLEPALEAVDVLCAQMLGTVHLDRLVEELE